MLNDFPLAFLIGVGQEFFDGNIAKDRQEFGEFRMTRMPVSRPGDVKLPAIAC